MSEDEKWARFCHLFQIVIRDRPLGVYPMFDFTAEYFALRKDLFGV